MRLELLGGVVELDRSLLDGDAAELRRQVREYAAGERRRFDLSVTIPETYTNRVMGAMSAIPYGETRTYGQLAAELGSGPRAVGGACGRNLLPVVVPCHRVIRSDGSLAGYSAPGGVDLKRRLLEHESRHATTAGARQSTLTARDRSFGN